MKKEVTDQKYKICPNCSFFCSISESDEYCSLCGAKLIDICLNCGESITNPYAQFCKYCGAQYPGRKKDEKKSKREMKF
ncbi:MAG: hypothetical protein DRP89_01605 [Candidatus Neomarinimicrobiota bacterium]|nr:MAG: hypothetical protein DRP89_01605 [Candidatus Neomarinimicrobiota bacterium]